MNRFTRHILIPAILPLIFFAAGLSPVEVLGCRNRGLLALAISFVSGILALRAVFIGVRAKLQGNPDSLWWAISTLILAIPVIGMILLA